MRNLQVMGVSFDGAGSSGGGGVELLGVGLYYIDGDGSAELPIAGSDWQAWNGTDDITATGNTISCLEVTAPGQPTVFNGQWSWKGTVTAVFKKGDASSLADMSFHGETVPDHTFAYISDPIEYTVAPAEDKVAFINVMTQSDGSGGNIRLEAGDFT